MISRHGVKHSETMAKFIVKTTGQFGKDLKLAKKRGLDLND